MHHYWEPRGEPTDFAEPVDDEDTCCELAGQEHGAYGCECACHPWGPFDPDACCPFHPECEHAAAPDLLTTLETLTRYADGALGWLNALHDAMARDDVLVTTMPNNFGRPALCQAIADAHRAIAAVRGEGAAG